MLKSFLSTKSALLGSLSASAVLLSTLAAQAVPPPLVISGASPFAGCFIANEDGTNYLNAEVEPWVEVSPRNEDNIIAGWQQDRWSNGGSRSLMSAYSRNGGKTWTRVVVPGINKCSGGTGEFAYDRSTDPWIAISPNGAAYYFTLSFSAGDFEGTNAMLVSRSTNGGASWGKPQVLIRDVDGPAFSDKNSITADPENSKYVYATWDRLLDLPVAVAGGSGHSEENGGNEAAKKKPGKGSKAGKRSPRIDGVALASERRKNALRHKRTGTAAKSSKRGAPLPPVENPSYEGPTYFARTINGGKSWEAAKEIYNPGGDSQTINNRVVVLDDGTVLNFYTELLYDGSSSIGYVKSTDHGATFGGPNTAVETVGSPDGNLTPNAQEPVRDADILFDVAIGPEDGTLYLVWEDARQIGVYQVAFSESKDNGVTWSDPVFINKTPVSANPLRNQAFIPSVEVGEDHKVYVTYYDYRYDRSKGEKTDYWAIQCDDEETNCTDPANWRKERRLTQKSFDMLDAPVARGHFLGDYMGLVKQGDVMRAVFGVSVGNDENEMVTAIIR